MKARIEELTRAISGWAAYYENLGLLPYQGELISVSGDERKQLKGTECVAGDSFLLAENRYLLLVADPQTMAEIRERQQSQSAVQSKTQREDEGDV